MNAQLNHIEVGCLLIDLEAELRRLQWWQPTQPCAEALASTVPFCADTLGFDQWLQFVFLPTLQQLIARGMALPTHCQITPMAEEFLRPRGLSIDDSGYKQPTKQLLVVLAALDALMG